MKRLTDLSVDRPLPVLVALLLATVGLSLGLGRIEADSDVLRDLPPHLPAKALYDRIGEMFPSKEMVMVGVESEALWTAEGLRQLDELTRAIDALPVVQRVVSPTSATVVVGTPEGMEIREAADPLPADDAAARALRDFLVAQDATSGTVVSQDGRVAAVLVFLQARLATTESKAAGQVYEAAVAHAGDLTVYPAGRPMASYLSSRTIGKETGMLTSAALLLMIVLLGLLFANARGVLLPLAVVVAATLWTLGGMGWVGVPMTHALEALPIMLIAIGVADGVHIVQAFVGRVREAPDAREAARATMDDLRSPVIMTSVTTAVGFLALNTSGVPSIMTLGLLVAFGVAVALLFSLSFVPAVLALLPLPKGAQRASAAGSGGRLQRLMVAWGELLFRRKAAATAALLVFVALCAVGALRVRTETSLLSNFPEDDPIRVSSDFFGRHLVGVTNLQVVFEGAAPGAVQDPAFLARIAAFEDYARGLDGVGQTTSILPILRSMNRVMHAGDAAWDRLPAERELEQGFDYRLDEEGNEIAVPVTHEVAGRDVVAGYFALLEMSGRPGDLANFVTDDHRSAKVTVFLKSDRKQAMDRVVASLREHLGEAEGLRVEMTGMAVLMLAVNDLITRGQSLSILVSLVLVFAVTALMFRSAALGLANVVPLFGAVFFNFGVMGLLGLDLNLMTMGVASMAIGVGVDFAIHFVHRYRASFAAVGEPREALRRTMAEAGVAIFMNMVAVAGGFLTLLLASFQGVVSMGLLISLIMTFSALGALTILPLIFTGLRPKAVERGFRGGGAALLVFGLLAVPARAGEAPQGEAGAFMTQVLDRASFRDMTGTATLTLTAANGAQKVREFRMASRKNGEGETDMVMIVEAPADMRGTGFLLLGHAGRDDDRTIYVPALRRSNRIVGAGRGGAFMSSDFSVDDIGRPELLEWTWAFAKGDDGAPRVEVVDGQPCRVVEATAASDEVARDTGYARVLWYVDEALMTSRRAEYFDKQGLLFKRLEVGRIEQLGGVPFATDMTMTHLGTGHSSRMTMQGLAIDQGVDPAWFTNRTLQNGF